MKKITLIFSLGVDIIFLRFFFLQIFGIFFCGLSGKSTCTADSLIFLFLYFIFIPTVFGILSYSLAKEKFLKQSFLSFLISFSTALIVWMAAFFIA